MLMVAKHIFYGMTINDIGKISHVLKHSHRRCVVGAFDIFFHEGSIWTGPRAVISFFFHRSIFLHFVHNCTKFYEKYIKYDDKKKYIDDYGSGIFTKQRVRQIYN